MNIFAFDTLLVRIRTVTARRAYGAFELWYSLAVMSHDSHERPIGNVLYRFVRNDAELKAHILL